MDSDRGFTLMELVIVLAIMAILSSLIVPSFISHKKMKDHIYQAQLEHELNTKLRDIYIETGYKFKIDLPPGDELDKNYIYQTVDSTNLGNLPTHHWITQFMAKYRIVFDEDYEYRYSETGTFGTIEIRPCGP